MSGRARFGLLGLGVLLLMVAEIAAIVWVSSEIGWWTVLILILTTLLGFYLLQREWRKAWGALADAARSGTMPAGKLTDASLILVGGILLVLPGLLTDVVGVVLLLPFTRPFARSAITWMFSKLVNPVAVAPTVIRGQATDDDTLVPGIDAEPTVIEGTVVDDDQ
ncbi:FxsA family protein [Tessaracoccus flavus]|uniref:Uncharacterized protein n=1 Tax=Tessaracoccus flavus TaxID=1610493 RepID=A0A1Q2CE92_9ACTN|nr:FxsA family protein [Tessaracoccus flavus]AQP44417.1 hypothetical protein RPIT_05980 [Tessaracoccus flavus]SDY68775.1 UPF0716 protein FxsA [Tessaracoccus flavus]